VKLKKGRQAGEVMQIDGQEVTVVFGNLKAKVKVRDLIVV